MKVSLIHYNEDRVTNEPGDHTVVKHLGHMPNIQLLYVAAILEKTGRVEIQYFDETAMELSRNKIIADLKAFSPDLVGLSVFTSHFHQAKAWAGFVKMVLPKTRVMLGGVHTSIFPIETLRFNPDVDFVCVGEAEMVLPEFIKRFEAGEDFSGMQGLVWREGEKIKYEGPAKPCLDLDSVPFPARRLVPNEKYFNFISTRKNYTVFNTSRGCPFNCIFCEAGGQKWRARSAENVTAEFEECYEKFGIREVDIFDSSFTVSKKRVLEICRNLIKSGLNKKIIWDVRSRVDTIDEETLEALKEAGCYRIFFGIESANPSILKRLRKEVDLEKISRIVKKADELGISTFGYFIVGAPGETAATVRETVKFAKTLPLDFAIFNCLTAFPKTELYEKFYLPSVKKDFWQEYISSPSPPKDFMGRPWTRLQNDMLHRMAHRGMLEFYFRPGQILRALKTVRSFDQLKRYLLAGIDMAKDSIFGMK